VTDITAKQSCETVFLIFPAVALLPHKAAASGPK